MSAESARTVATHTPRVVVVGAVCLVLAFVVQTAALPAVGLSAAVPLMFATVVVLAMAWGPTAGALTGFAAGLLLDVTGSGALGVGALVGCLTGWAAARIPTDRWRWSGAGWAIVATGLAAGADTMLDALLQGRVPLPAAGWVWMAAGAVVCTLTLLPARRRLREVVR